MNRKHGSFRTVPFIFPVRTFPVHTVHSTNRVNRNYEPNANRKRSILSFVYDGNAKFGFSKQKLYIDIVDDALCFFFIGMSFLRAGVRYFACVYWTVSA